jgi:predicted nucleic acid-binding Zn ribbon protein
MDINNPLNSGDLVVNSVTPIVKNSHCIVCGTAFPIARMSKLYCSAKCKQFGFNHKEKIDQLISIREKGIGPKPIDFYIDDFVKYDVTQKKLRKYKLLDKKAKNWEAIDQEIGMKHRSGFPISDNLWNSHSRDKLTASEDFEYYEIANETDEQILEIELKELSLERWSFLRSLNPDLTEIKFYQFVASIGKDFMNQLNINEGHSENGNLYATIRNKYINHCNLIVDSKICFIERKNDVECPEE